MLRPEGRPEVRGVVADEVTKETSGEVETSTAPKGSRRTGAIVAFAVMAVVALILGASLKVRGPSRLGSNPSGVKVPDFTLPLLGSAGTLKLSDLRGRPVVLNFWASWCGPCKEEAPVLAAGDARWRSRGVVFLGVDAQDGKTWAEQFMQRYGIHYRSVIDTTGAVMSRFGVTGFPETFFIDPGGRIQAKWQGPLDQPTLDQYVQAILPGQG